MFKEAGPSAIRHQPSSLLHLPSDFSHQSSVLYRLGPVTIVRDDKGRVHKVITP